MRKTFYIRWRDKYTHSKIHSKRKTSVSGTYLNVYIVHIFFGPTELSSILICAQVNRTIARLIPRHQNEMCSHSIYIKSSHITNLFLFLFLCVCAIFSIVSPRSSYNMPFAEKMCHRCHRVCILFFFFFFSASFLVFQRCIAADVYRQIFRFK